MQQHIKNIPYVDPRQTRAHSPVQLARRLVFGNPIATEHAQHTLLSKFLALPVFSSDAISSVAYATQQIVLALGAAGLWTMQCRGEYTHLTMLISCLIVGLLAIVVISYWQTIFAYPNGGGSYIVSKDNLGALPGLVAAAALLIDYVLTVSVSIAAGVQNLKDVPLFSGMRIADHMVFWCVLCIAILTLANLRGLKESGKLFALPTYVFVAMCYLMIAVGLLGPQMGWHFHTEFVNQEWPGGSQTAHSMLNAAGIVVLLRAFANGCSAMTGTEAVSNGVPAFREPKSKNAALTLASMGFILGSIFLGISCLSMQFHVVYWEHAGTTAPAVIDQISGAIFGKSGPWSWAYITTQVFTALILVLAANTSFADFPRLSSILARDGYMPRQLSNLGDKLVFNNGIIALGILSALLIVVKNGSVDAMIPLYAIGVFLAFTLSQSGMVKHWWTLKGAGWKHRAVINGMGAISTGLVLMDIAAEKFMDGAWLVIVLVIALVWIFNKIADHYKDVADQLRLAGYQPVSTPKRNTVLILVQGMNMGTMQALDYARSIKGECSAVHVELDCERTEQFQKRWTEDIPDVPLLILESPYRSLLSPILSYLDRLRDERPDDRITVVIGEFVPITWWHSLMHGNTGLLLKFALLGRNDVVVANVRYQLERRPAAAPAETQRLKPLTKASGLNL